MLICLSKKIAVPNQRKIRSISWSSEHGFIACGADDGFLKVLKLDNSETRSTGFNLPKNLSMNQTLEGHNGDVLTVIWNEKYQKLTSSDSNGLIIVWMLYKGSWHEEMVNNRNKSIVAGMAWNTDGLKICIAYEDGAVIVGSVDGNRLWGKDIKSIKLTCVEWSPDGEFILFGSTNDQVYCYDEIGNFISKVSLPATNGLFGRFTGLSDICVIDIQWFKNGQADNPLVIALSNGLVQMMKNESDDNPIIIDTKMSITSICWNFFGNTLAVTGSYENYENNLTNIIKFYDTKGEFIQSLKVPGKQIIIGCAWERESLRLALGIDYYIFFANIRPSHKWAYFSSTLVLSLSEVNIHAKDDVLFISTDGKFEQIKNIKNLKALNAFGQYCIIATADENLTNNSLLLCNTIGVPIQSITVDIQIIHVTINSTIVVASSEYCLLVWNFLPLINENLNSKAFVNEKTFEKISISNNIIIKCISLSEKLLIVALESYEIQCFHVPDINLLTKFKLEFSPKFISLNGESDKFAMITDNNTLFFYDNNKNKLIDFEKKDVWDFCWSYDNNDSFVVSEKFKLLLYNNWEIDESIPSNGYICEYKDMIICAALIDLLAVEYSTKSEETKSIEHYIFKYEIKTLRKVKDLLKNSNISQVFSFIEENPHFQYPKLWSLLADLSLRKLEFKNAELSLVRCKDYKGIQFIKKVLKLPKEELRKAEVYSYFGEYDKAEKIYIDIDRVDLAINLRKIIQDWDKVIKFSQSTTFSDLDMKEAIYNLGLYYYENLRYNEAIYFLKQVEPSKELIHSLYNIEDYDELAKLINSVNDRSLLLEIGRIFKSVGLCSEAVEAYKKTGQMELAIKCCVDLNEWRLAITLAEDHQFSDIDTLLNQYASHLFSKEKYIDIIELYRKANRIHDAANLILKLINQRKNKSVRNLLWLKKCYVLIGFLYQDYISINKQEATLNYLLIQDDFSISSRNMLTTFDQPWKGAEAYHYYLLAQRQITNGYYEAALKTSLNLMDYDDFIDIEDIYSLIAIASCSIRNFYICSKAFIKLESSNTIPEERREAYQNLAYEIFAGHAPKVGRNEPKIECYNCGAFMLDWVASCPTCNLKMPICIATGRTIIEHQNTWTCSKCKHQAILDDLLKFNNCPLCHSPIKS